jgi:hypothetical protein
MSARLQKITFAAVARSSCGSRKSWKHTGTKRYPWITEATRKVRQKRFVLDGEAVMLGVDGVSDFRAACEMARGLMPTLR